MVSNICTSGQPAHIASLVENGCIVPLCDLLDISDSKILLVGLEALESICKVGLQTNNVSFAQMIEQCSGVERLECLQEHKNEDVYEKVVMLIENYFAGEDEEDQNIAPQAGENQFSFGLNSPATGKFANDFGPNSPMFGAQVQNQPAQFSAPAAFNFDM